MNLDNVPLGKLPYGWIVEATNSRGPLAAWQVIKDTTAPSADHVLALTSPNHTFGGTFNICWTNTVAFLNGEIEVRFKAVTLLRRRRPGRRRNLESTGQRNYYIARFNPLENNFRIYYVYDGARKILADAKVSLPAEKWHTLKITQRGSQFEGYLNGEKLLEGSNTLFKNTGGVGLWTKADAVTSFDDFTARPAGK